MRAILSVHDKTGLVEFARGLADLGWELFSTGNTQRVLAEGGVPVASVSDLTGFPEIMDGRVKTLHPGVHAGILANRAVPAHMAQLAEQGFGEVDLVAVSLYPFEATVAREGVTFDEAIENIDIGGPTMIRAAAKNHASVTVLVDPAYYPRVLDELRAGGLSAATRRELADVAFAHTAAYDSAIAAWLRGRAAQDAAVGRADAADEPADAADEPADAADETAAAGSWPAQYSLAGNKVQDLRYGENPHQRAALYRVGARPTGIAAATQIQGIELSYNNIVDLDAAWALVDDLPRPAAVIIKHTNPCGAAVRPTLSQAYAAAYECDTTSAFGGIVALNVECDGETARAITSIFVEGVVAPSFSADAVAAFAAKPKVRVLEVRPAPPTDQLKPVSGGFLVQSPDTAGGGATDRASMTSAGAREPTEDEWQQLLFAWRVVKHVKSNAIVLARDLTAVGVGAGQMSRVESVQIAARRAGDRATGTVLASDAFFPMPDGIEAAADAGVTAIIQPGGSIKDAVVREVADRLGLAMVYTGERHFRH